jgi:putative PIN family toxin of toxin-antitoxin system
MALRVVLDTNVILQGLPRRGQFHGIIRALVLQKFEMVVSNEILLEYEEIIRLKGRAGAWEGFWEVLDVLRGYYKTVKFVDPVYRFMAIVSDPDDNKFVDAGVCGEADLIITEDRSFKELGQSSTVNIKPMQPIRFLDLLRTLEGEF